MKRFFCRFFWRSILHRNEPISFHSQNKLMIIRVDSESWFHGTGKGFIAGEPMVWFTAATDYTAGISQLEHQYCFIRDDSLYLIGAMTDTDPNYFATMEPLMDAAIQAIEFR